MEMSNTPDWLKPPAYLGGPLFDMQGDWLEAADLDGGANYHCIEGYRKAALHVAEQATVHPGSADQLVYPVVFLFRHAIELLLKQLLELFGDTPPTHRIGTLWTTLRPLLESESLPASELDSVQAPLMELDAMDGGATGFRYAYLPHQGDDP